MVLFNEKNFLSLLGLNIPGHLTLSIFEYQPRITEVCTTTHTQQILEIPSRIGGMRVSVF